MRLSLSYHPEALMTNKIWIGLSKSKKPTLFSRAIKLFQKTEYSHAFGMFYSKDAKTLLVMHACGQAVQTWPIKELVDEKEIMHLFEFEVSEELWFKTIANHFRLDGTEYSTRQIVAIALNSFTNGLIEKIFDDNGEERFHCSEYTETILASMGIATVSQATGISNDMITPKDTFTHLNDLSIRGVCKKVDPRSVDNVLASL